MAETFTAVLDRVVDGVTAVLLLEEADEVVEQRDIDVEQLPADSRHEGAVFEVKIEAGELVDANYLPEIERDRRESAQDRFDRLANRRDEN